MTRTVSIVTVALNAECTIRRCLESVQAQSILADHIVVDGGSTDGTLQIVSEFSHRISHVVSEPDSGIYDAMNKGIALATGEIVGFLNADDEFATTDALEQVSGAISPPDIEACYSDVIFVNNRDPSRTVRFWKGGTFSPQRFYWGWMPPGSAFYCLRELYDRFGLYETSFGTAGDYELMLRFLMKERVRARYIPKTLVRMRLGGVSNSSIANRLKAHRMDRIAWKKNGLRPYPWTMLMKPARKISQWLIRGPNLVAG